METYPKNLIEQYLKASAKLKKIERVVFKRFAPNIADVKNDFLRLAIKFEDSGIHQYAAMCHMGQAKCDQFTGALQDEANAYLRAARAFLQAHNENAELRLRSVRDEFRQGALHCYQHAIDRVQDNSVTKAAIIREMRTLQAHIECTSSFASPTHRINDLELAAELSIRREDFVCALRQLDDIVDNVYERKMQDIYCELLHSVEILRLLLLVQLNLPPSRQSPAHIKLIEHYYQLASFESPEEVSDEPNDTNKSSEDLTQQTSVAAGGGNATHMAVNSSGAPGAYVPLQQQYALAEIIYAWAEYRLGELKYQLMDFAAEFNTISNTERHLLKHIYAELSKTYF